MKFKYFHALAVSISLLSAGCGMQGESSKMTSTTIVADKVVEAKVGTIVLGNYSGAVTAASIGGSSNYYAGQNSFAVSQVACDSWPDTTSLTCKNAPVQAIIKLTRKNGAGQTTDVDYQYLCSSWSGTPYSKTTITTNEKSWDGKTGSTQQVTVLSDEVPKQVFLNPLTNIAYRLSPTDYEAGTNRVNTYLRSRFSTPSADYFASAEVDQRAVDAAVAQFPVNNYGKCPGAVSAALPARPVVVYSDTPTAIAPQGTLQLSSNLQSVTWRVVEANGGTITADGLYTAPATAGSYTVRAINSLDTSKSGTYIITVGTGTSPTPGSGTVSVAVSPSSPIVAPGGSQTFVATVAGSTNQAVTWQVVEPGGGSITSAGVYTAPAAAGTYHIRATSSGDPTRYITITVNVTASNSIAANQTWRSVGTANPSITITIGNVVTTQQLGFGFYMSYYSGSIESPIGTTTISGAIDTFQQISYNSAGREWVFGFVQGTEGLAVRPVLNTIETNKFQADVSLIFNGTYQTWTTGFERIK
jgi:hypothetical protein